MHWFPWFPGDYQRDTAHLSFVEDAAYRRLLDAYYMRGKISANADDLLRVCRAITADEQKAVQRVASEFFEQLDGFLIHQKVEATIAKNRATSAKRSAAGKNGARKTNAKRTANAAANAAANADDLPPKNPANGSAYQNHIKPIRPNKYSDDDFALAKEMSAKILELSPSAKKPNLEKWASEIRLMREQDSRNLETIREVFRWANLDSFWRANILSPAKLREKFDQLSIQRASKTGGVKSNQPAMVSL